MACRAARACGEEVEEEGDEAWPGPEADAAEAGGDGEEEEEDAVATLTIRSARVMGQRRTTVGHEASMSEAAATTRACSCACACSSAESTSGEAVCPRVPSGLVAGAAVLALFPNACVHCVRICCLR